MIAAKQFADEGVKPHQSRRNRGQVYHLGLKVSSIILVADVHKVDWL